MAKTLSDITRIVRKATGRVDQSISDGTIHGYINDFYSLEAGQETRLFDNQSFYEFSTVASTDQYSIDMDASSGIGYSILTDPVWVDGFSVTLYTSPELFFAKWPETQDYTEQRPEDILWYNNELIFRPSPDDVYTVKISAYKTNRLFKSDVIPTGEETIAEDYWWRYVAYGAAIDLLADAGEFEKVGQITPVFERYKGLVNARTFTQHKDRILIRNF